MASSYEDLLQRSDHPQRMEAPLGFDRDEAERRLRSLLPELSNVIGQSLRFEDGVYIQDASFFAQVFLPQEALQQTVEPPRYVVLRFSNFADMIAVKPEDAVKPLVLDRLRALLESAGYVYVPENVLDVWYTGRLPESLLPRPMTWWDRYFDWL